MSNDTTNLDTEPSLVDQMSTASFSRRRFLIGSGAVAGLALVTAACGSDDDDDTAGGSGSDDTTAGGGADAKGDLAVAEFAAGLEVLAVGTYTAALEAATSGALGAVPPAVATFVTTAKGHHQEHLDAWNKVITGGGGKKVTEPNAQLKPVVDAEFAKVKDVGGAAKLALMLEDIAAQTYLSAIPALKSKDAIKQAGQIQIVDQQHIAVLLFALGEYPVPEVFQKTDKAAKPA